jgi:hypothetical protein
VFGIFCRRLKKPLFRPGKKNPNTLLVQLLRAVLLDERFRHNGIGVEHREASEVEQVFDHANFCTT